ncbi:MAG: hypothetical protein RMK57_07605 [Bryobacterales bacterium]|nr:hypothetical protein [Bryobacterales bacterium]
MWRKVTLLLSCLLAAACPAGACEIREVFFFSYNSAREAVKLYQALAHELQKTGWWKFVCSHTDRIVLHNAPVLEWDGPRSAVGLASFQAGRRVMAIATKGYSLEQLAGVMVHEAGHLELIRRYKTFGDEAWAEHRRQQFLDGLKGPKGAPPAPDGKAVSIERISPKWFALSLIAAVAIVILLALDDF